MVPPLFDWTNVSKKEPLMRFEQLIQRCQLHRWMMALGFTQNLIFTAVSTRPLSFDSAVSTIAEKLLGGFNDNV
jgi:hypothetical protein